MKFLYRLQYFFLMAFSRCLALGGTSLLRQLAKPLGGALWIFVPKRRWLAINSIKKRLHLEEDRAKDIARQSFYNNALSFLEIILAPAFDFSRPDLRVDCKEMLAKLRKDKCPVVVTTAHLGAWELSAGLVSDFLPGRPGMVVVRNYKNKALREYMFKMRGAKGGKIVGHRNAIFPALKILRQNGLVGVLADHNASSDEAIFMPFLGKVAAVNIGPAVLAIRAGAVICPLVVVREGKNYALLGDEILDTRTLTGSHEEKIKEAATFYTKAIEKWVQKYPAQWFWMHKRWKTRPPKENIRPYN